MQIFTELNENPHLSLALGYFDGVHSGHQAVIQNAVDFAAQNGVKSAVITFKDHPCCFFYGVCPKYILSRIEREKHIKNLGVDYLYELDFDENLSSLSAEAYLKSVLIKNFKPKAITTGFNHNFGAQKSGDVDFLKKKQEIYNYKHFQVPPKKLEEELISSTAIRNLLASGKVEKANKMLGYNFSLSGKVIQGAMLGRQIGYRTANIVYPNELIGLPYGAYSTKVTLNGATFSGVTNFGIRPTISESKFQSLETHILNFDEDIYGEKITVEFLKMIRPEKKFASLDELKKQISIDILSI